MLKNNVGTIDRVVRLVAGVVGLSMVFAGPQTNWGYLGLVPLFTGLIGSCPAYQIFGINTCPIEKARQ